MPRFWSLFPNVTKFDALHTLFVKGADPSPTGTCVGFLYERDTTMATFFNQATLTYRGGATNSNIVTGEIREVLSANKNASTDTYTPGDELTYFVNIINTGATALTGLTVTDDLGAYPFGAGTLTPLTYVDGSAQYFVGGVPQTAPTVVSTSPLIVSGLTVPAGGNAQLVYRAVPNEYAPLASTSTILNTVTITGPGIPTPVRASETVTILGGTALTIAKALNPTTVSDGERLTYTFVIENSGNEEAVATDDLVVSDTFDPALSDIVVTLNGTTLPAGSYTYDEATGAFATNPGVLTVPAATYTQDPVTGAWTLLPGTTVLQVSGTV